MDDYAFNDSTASVTPDWYDADQPLRSAVAHLASCSSKFNWVGVYVLNGTTLELGPYIGAPTEHTRIEVGVGVCGTAVARNEDMNVPDVTLTDNYLACSLETKSELVVLIRSQGGRIVGQIDIDSHEHAAFGPDEERLVRDVAEAIGERWLEEPAADRGQAATSSSTSGASRRASATPSACGGPSTSAHAPGPSRPRACARPPSRH